MYFGVVSSQKIFFSYISTSSLSYDSFLKRKLVYYMLDKNKLGKSTSYFNIISTECPKESFNDTVFQHFMDELKYCYPDM